MWYWVAVYFLSVLTAENIQAKLPLKGAYLIIISRLYYTPSGSKVNKLQLWPGTVSTLNGTHRHFIKQCSEMYGVHIL